MADVFLSYAREDREAAARLAQVLEGHGLSVWWDREIQAGRSFDDVLEEALASASAVVVLWSRQSVTSDWVRAEAAEAQSRGKLLPVRVEPVDVPLGFRHINTADVNFLDPQFEVSEEFTRLTDHLHSVIGRFSNPADRVAESPRASTRPWWRLPRLPKKRQTDDATAREPIKMAVNSPRKVGPAWEIMRGYIYQASSECAVREDAERLRPATDAQHASAQANVSKIKAGTPITVIADVTDAECRRREQRFIWREGWHKTDFDVRYLGESIGPRVVNISWFAGMVCIGQVSFQVQFTDQPQQPPTSPSLAIAAGYESVFVSYSTKDSTIVDWLETTYTALGMTYLRDIKALRSGEKWDEQLLKLIERADLFQLCWSANAKQSQYVADECRFALGLKRPNFIRPCYWEQPMPEPPPELQPFHFARLKLSGLMRMWFRVRARFG